MENGLGSEKATIQAVASTKISFPSIDEEVVGFEDDAKCIIKQLTGGTKGLDVISIVGMPGLGKTTLARKVFNHFIDNKHFDVRAWCVISKEYNLRQVFSKILKQAIGDIDGIKDEDMPPKLRQSLMRKRYLIVLDDIWNIKVWEELRLSFPQDGNGSRILVTTRDGEVARQLKHHSNPHFLRFLTVDESWDLLKKKTFQGEFCPSELIEAGLGVAKSCKGLPLVIVLSAGIISKQRQVSFWNEIANDLSSHVLEEQSMKIIESSYNLLEDHLKSCLIYLGMFPGDYRIPQSDLQKLWIAESFVHDMNTENMEKAPKIFLNDLVNRSLVMVSKRTANGDIKYCTLHDVVREFCLRKLANEKFMQLIVPFSPYQPSDEKEHRLCMYVHDGLINQLKYEHSMEKIPMLSGLKLEGEPSAQCCSSQDFIAHPTLIPWERISLYPFLQNFRHIRALHLLDIYLHRAWDTPMQAVPYLRYLAIKTQEFDFQWVSHLLDLQTLRVVWDNPNIISVKTSSAIWKMQKLRHVDIHRFSFKWEDSDRAILEESSEITLPNLKTFGRYFIYMADMAPEFWWRFPNIEELKLHIVEPEAECLPEFSSAPMPKVDLPNLEKVPIQSLEVGFSHTWGGSIGQGSSVVFPSSLKYLCLYNTFLTEKLVSSIASLQSLERLKLLQINDKLRSGYIRQPIDTCWDFSDYTFQALKYLKLNFPGMTKWQSSETSFPMLEKLVIDDCFRLQDIPPSFADIETLKLIKLISCRKSLETSALEIKQEVEEITGCDRLQVHVKRQFL